MITESQLIDYFKSLGIDIHTSTKARGHQGFFLDGRIDISKNLPKEKVIPTLLHEFAHYIHSKLEKNTSKTGGSLKVLFNSCLDFEEEFPIPDTNTPSDILQDGLHPNSKGHAILANKICAYLQSK